MMSPHCGTGKTGPTWVPWPFGAGLPFGSEIESSLTVSRTYGFVTEDVAWQMVTFKCGAARAGGGAIAPSTTTLRVRPTTSPTRVVAPSPVAPRFTPCHTPPHVIAVVTGRTRG